MNGKEGCTIDALVFSGVLNWSSDSGSGTEGHLTEEVLLLAHHDSHESVLAPGLAPGVLSDPVLVVVLIYIPSYNFPLLKTSEFLFSFNVLVYTFLICKQIEIDLTGGDYWTIGHNLPLDILNLLKDTEIEDLVSVALLHLNRWAVGVPGLVVVGEASLVDEATGSDELQEAHEDSSVAAGLQLLLVVTGSVGLGVEGGSLVVLRLEAEAVGEGGGGGNGVVRRAVALVLDWGSAGLVLLSEVVSLRGESSIIIDLTEVKSVALAVSVENIVHSVLGILEHHALEEFVSTGPETVGVPLGVGVPGGDGVLVKNGGGLDVDGLLGHHENDGGHADEKEHANDDGVAVFVEEGLLFSPAVHAGSSAVLGAGG